MVTISKKQISFVAGGRGMGSKENFDKLYELADAIGGVVGLHAYLLKKAGLNCHIKVGQTGKTGKSLNYTWHLVSPALSTRERHLGSDTIVAITTIQTQKSSNTLTMAS